MLTIKFQIFIIFFYYVFTVFSETSFIPKGQRAEIFELTDNEVPVFRITLPDSEFLTLKEKAKQDGISNMISLINSLIKNYVEIINNQNLFEAFPNTNFSEILPELPLTESGFPNIDETKFYIDKYHLEGMEIINTFEILNEVFNNNSYLNLFKVFYVLSELKMSENVDIEFKKFLLEMKECIIIDENGNYICNIGREEEVDEKPEEMSLVDTINIIIQSIIEEINGQNFFEAFPNTNFTEILPDLPLTEKGYPNIDYTKYVINEDDIQNFDENEDNSINILLNILNDDSNLNMINIIYELSKLEMASNVDYEFMELIEFLAQYIMIDENGEFKINKSFENYYYYKFKNNTTKEFYEIIKNYNNNDIRNTFSDGDNDFKTKNATMIVEIKNQNLSFNKITFSLSGQFSRGFSRVGFNLKIRGGKELFGRRQFKLRADASEPSYMRTKLMCDIHNRLGIPSLSANYATLYINEEYMGLYIFIDAFKESWIEYVYGEKDTAQLYKGNSGDLSFDFRLGFKNENNEITDNTELYKFLAFMSKAKSASDVESIFDLDQFYKEIAIELLVNGWDHVAHNFYIYKNHQNNRWIYFIHDFDLDLGVELGGISRMKKDIIEYNLRDMRYSNTMNKIISSDIQKFNETLKDIVINAFNPTTLFPRIDELKSYIEPYVKLDKTKNENGEYPGTINYDSKSFFSYEKWEDSTEFTIIDDVYYGLKQYILLRYRYICKSYGIECDPKYLDETMELPNNKTETLIQDEPTQIVSTTSAIETTTQTSIISDSTPTPTPTPSLIPESSTTINCYSEFLGYSCCSAGNTTVYATDEYGDWGYDFSKNEWCGLTKYEGTSDETNNECWSEVLGYSCCKGCKIYETDSDGSWGYELNQWCGIIPSQCQK